MIKSIGLSKRRFLATAGAFAIGASVFRPIAGFSSEEQEYDVIIVGGGNAGLPTAITAARRGASVLIIDAAPILGGTLTMSGGRMSAAGTKLQKSLGIEDHPDIHFEDVMSLSRGTANPEILRLAVDRAANGFDWLMDQGFKPKDGLPVARGSTHAGQSRPRYVWHEDAGMGILNVLEDAINPLVSSGKIVTQLDTKVTSLDVTPDNIIQGVVGRTFEGEEKRWRGRNVVLTSGGYAANSKMFAELEGAKDYSQYSYPFCQGIGIELGLSVGGFLRGGENHLPSFGAIMASDEIPSNSMASLNHHPSNRETPEIWVNAEGQRFMAEDEDSIHEKELAVIKQPHERFWVVFNESMLKENTSPVRNWDTEQLEAAFNDDLPSFVKAPTLSKLGELAGIDASGLEKTVKSYNAAQKAGKDTAHNRKHMPTPIGEGPYYAIRVQSSQVLTFAGLAVDKELRVLRSDKTSVPNLFAAGEVIGAGQIMGRCYAGGMSVTPALSFGHWLGSELIPIS